MLLTLTALVIALGSAGTASAQLTPPWCGTPEPDAAGNLPDGSQPTHPAGSFPHIPYYAIGCTLDGILADSLDSRMSLEVIGQSAGGRDMYGVVINQLTTPEQQRKWQRWEQWRSIALEDPDRAQALLEKWAGEIKVPIYVQGAIHGNEYEGVESNMQLIEELATTPYGTEQWIDDILDDVVVVFNVIQNPDGRVAGTRANSNGFDLNRDFLTQSQPETRNSVAQMQKWLPVNMLDLHGYVTPMLIEATTKPHNPSIDYDLWIKWNQSRIDANEAALAASNFNITRPINDWCADGNPAPSSGICPDGNPPGPAVAEGWDDWGPFYTPMYNQHVGLDGSTTEMCNQTGTACGLPGSTTHTRGRLGAYEQQRIVTLSTLEFLVENGDEMLYDLTERYRRGVAGEARPPCCEPPFDVDNNWMKEFPAAYVIPLGAGQRSDAEANRLVAWLLFNGIEVDELKQDTVLGDRTFEKGSYVIWMDQAHRGLADTALNVGVDISERISILYAPPAAWSHGYLWGADVAEIPLDAGFDPITNRVKKPTRLDSGVEPGRAEAYALELDSATAVRLLNELVGGGLAAELALEPFASKTSGMLPAGTVLFAADQATKVTLNQTSRDYGVVFRRIVTEDFPSATDPIEGVPRILALTGATNQDVWSLRNLGFPVDTMTTGAINSAPEDPLPNYDVIWNTGAWPSAANQTARDRLTAFFAAGGGYLGAGGNGANFLTAGGQLSGLTVSTRGGSGRSGIVLWTNEGGLSSPIVGAYPATDTYIMDPPSWFSAVPGSLSVAARLAETDFFLAGLWLFDAQSASAPGSPIVVHGTNDAGTARLVNFAMSPLYRADPEREWPMIGSGAYWVDQ
ncbi:MAG TPA: M14 family zinc carboxypeptidase [Gaiellaceae bacterium]|nr:M14 family zinc carboxypeptidase [Gaiellaceae bacterium]